MAAGAVSLKNLTKRKEVRKLKKELISLNDTTLLILWGVFKIKLLITYVLGSALSKNSQILTRWTVCFLFVRKYSLFVNEMNYLLFMNKKVMNNCWSNSTILVPNCWVFSKKSIHFLKKIFLSQESSMKYKKIVISSHKNGTKLGKCEMN